jgi:hypothetical protein
MAFVIGAKPGRVAFSKLEYAICNASYDFVSNKMKGSLDSLRVPLGYIIGSAAEEKDAMLKGAMESPLAVYDRFGPYSFLDREDALRDISITSKDLLKNLAWVEKVGNEWRDASWAAEMYKHVSKF